MKLLTVAGARPNFVKIAPLHHAFIETGKIVSKIIHTGQHSDPVMSALFFEQLDIPKPDYFMWAGTGTVTAQTARMMVEFEKVLLIERPDGVVVVGDVTSTLACALTAMRQSIPLIHVEAGLRSCDRTMPEEINRILTDHCSDYLFATESQAIRNLRNENIAEEKIFFVGNVMIDSLVKYRLKAQQKPVLEAFHLIPRSYILVTMHRPGTVDSREGLDKMLQMLKHITPLHQVVFPIHPRTFTNLESFGLRDELESIVNLKCIAPQGYLEFLKLMDNASLIITDSGGIQEESTFLQVPCFTLRKSTERPVTVEMGSNRLFPDWDHLTVKEAVAAVLTGEVQKGGIPPLWDGKTASRIAEVLLQKIGSS